ncbi:MAG: hypothetical protein ACOC97_06120, partial [Myxococcota bacterium]
MHRILVGVAAAAVLLSGSPAAAQAGPQGEGTSGAERGQTDRGDRARERKRMRKQAPGGGQDEGQTERRVRRGERGPRRERMRGHAPGEGRRRMGPGAGMRGASPEARQARERMRDAIANGDVEAAKEAARETVKHRRGARGPRAGAPDMRGRRGPAAAGDGQK